MMARFGLAAYFYHRTDNLSRPPLEKFGNASFYGANSSTPTIA
jgi:hypothetical protein